MKELNEINQTLKDLCFIFDKKIEDDKRFEERMKELDESINRIKSNHEQIKKLL